MNIHDPTIPTHDPDRQVGEVFRRLSAMRSLNEDAFARVVHAVLVALGRAAHEEGERRARTLAERTAPRAGDARVTAYAQRRRPDPDGFDIADLIPRPSTTMPRPAKRISAAANLPPSLTSHQRA